MQVPVNNFSPTTGTIILNASAARATHAANVDQWATWLAASSHAATPHLLTCSNNDTHNVGPRGIYTTSTVFSDYVTIPIIVPAFCNFMVWGAQITGAGEITADATLMTADALIKPQGQTLHTSEENDAESMASEWCAATATSGSADTTKPFDLRAGGVDGYSVLRRLEFRFAWRRVAAGSSFAVHGIYFQYWMLDGGKDLATFSTNTGGNDP